MTINGWRRSACVEMLFTEAGDDLPARIEAAGAAGMDAIEFWMWRGRDLEAIATAAARAGVEVAGICVEPWGQLTDPATHEEFWRGVRESCAAAETLGCSTLITQAGDDRPGVPRAEQHAAIVAALRGAAPIVAEAGITLIVEPLNDRIDHPGYFLTSNAEGIEIVKEVASPHVKMLYDRYHSLVMGEAIGEGVADDMDLVHHVHIADTGGRAEPGTGDADWAAEVAFLRERGYTGALGLEYRPTVATVESLKYFEDVLRG